MDGFAESTAWRCVLAESENDGHPFGSWSTGEQLAVALVLNDADHIKALGHTIADAIERLEGDLMGSCQVGGWLNMVRRAAEAQQPRSRRS